MSDQNVELLQKLNLLFNGGEWDAALDLFHPDVEFRDLQSAPDVPQTTKGRIALTSVLKQWMDAYEEFSADAIAYIDAEPWVIVEARWHGRGRGSGLPVDELLASASKVADGVIVDYLVGFPDATAALAHLGLKA